MSTEKDAKYTDRQINIALGIMSGRIDPASDLYYYDDWKHLYAAGEVDKLCASVNALRHRLKAEEILKYLLLNGKK